MKDELLYEQIIKEIRREIDAEILRQKEKAPSIAVLCSRFHVSPVTAVRALKELTASGYLRKLPGRGYFVAEKNEKIRKNICVGCLLRANYVSLTDHYFNEIIAGIEQAASLAKVNLIMSFLSTHLCNLQANLEPDLLESALEMNDSVSGFLIDERVPDSVVRDITERTGKPAVIINRTTALPLFSVSPNYRESLLKLVETLRRMQYNRFIFATSGMNHFAQQVKKKTFEEIVTLHSFEKKHYRFLDRYSIVPFEETYGRLLQYRQEIEPGRLAVITASDVIARELTERLLQDGIPVPGALGIAATDGMSITQQRKPEITTLKVDTVKMGVSAMDLLIREINKTNSEPPQNKLLAQNLLFGETI